MAESGTQYDAVIIGAGHNGLATAIYLARAGWKVVVVERQDTPGGAVRTAEVTLPGFRHDLCAMNLSMFAGSPFFQEFQNDLVTHGLEFVPATKTFSSVFPDDSWLGVDTDLETTASRIAAVSERDAVAWREMAADFGGTAPHLFAMLGASMPSWQLFKGLYRAWRNKGGKWCLDMLRLIVSSPREFLDENFESEKVRSMMAAWGMHLDFSPDVAGGALFPYLESMANQAFGMVIGKGGADTIIRSMVSLLDSLGGELRVSAEAAAIDLSGKRAVGVTLAGGKRLTARRAVIANLAPRALFGRLVPWASLPAGFAQRMRSFRHGPGTMMIHLAVSDLPDWRAGADLRQYAYVHVAPYLADMTRTYSEAVSGLLPSSPVLVVGQPTAIDPGRAPQGRHVLWIQVRVLPATIAGDAAGQIHSTEWDEVRESYADRAIEKIARYAPNLPDAILDRRVYSPLDLERENPNLVGGDSLGGSHHLNQNFLFRPVPGWSRYRMPVDNLYMVGASTWPGAGTGAGSGRLLGRMLAGR